MLSCSTCWNSARHRAGGDIAREILDLGFERIELGHGLRAPQVAGLLDAQQELGFGVSSVHCFCPLPPEVLADHPDCYEFTSHRAADRARAARLAIQTIRTAQRFGARCVVVHAGRIRTQQATARLRALAAEAGPGSKRYAAAKLDAVRRRERAGPLYLARSTACLREVAAEAVAAGILLGIENRDDIEAVPSERELPTLLDAVPDGTAYWHDFGHAQIKEHLGVLDHAQWLERIAPRIAGAHVHDVRWPFSDHRPPFTGEVAFEKLARRLPIAAEIVFEMHPRTPAAEIAAARKRWSETFHT